MFITDYGFVISGPRYWDGRIAVWGSRLATDCSKSPEPEEETKDASIWEVDGFEMVPAREIQFNLIWNVIKHPTLQNPLFINL